MPGGEFKAYDSNEVSVTVCGLPIEGGYGPDTFVEIEQDSDDFEDDVGVDGDVSRSKTNDKRATITLTLMQTSASNALLSALNKIDKTQSNGAGVGPFAIRDNQGTSLYAGEHSWIAKPPTATFAKKVSARVWKIRCIISERVDGGN